MISANPVSVDDFRARHDDGEFLGRRPAIELFGGRIVPCRTVESADSRVLATLVRWAAATASPNRHRVLIQAGIPLGPFEMPRPTMAWCSTDDRSEHPKAANLRLVIEVPRPAEATSDSSTAAANPSTPTRITPIELWAIQRRDLFATAGIAEYWLVDSTDQCVRVHREPEGGKYRQVIEHRGGGVAIRPGCEPAAGLELDRLFTADSGDAPKNSTSTSSLHGDSADRP